MKAIRCTLAILNSSGRSSGQLSVKRKTNQYKLGKGDLSFDLLYRAAFARV